jgi:hypothetical protein
LRDGHGSHAHWRASRNGNTHMEFQVLSGVTTENRRRLRGPIGFRLAHELEGLLRGIAADGVIHELEIQRLRGWLDANQGFTHIAPFAELAAGVEHALSDGVLTPEEIDDLLFVVSKYTTVNPFFDQLRSGIQVLMGVLAGVAADRELTVAEVRDLQSWLEEWHHLRGLWPVDECEAIVTYMLAHNRITQDAKYLLALSNEFPIGDDTPREAASALLQLSGICAVDPEIVFRDRTFVFTGESSRCERSVMEGRVRERGGHTHPNVTKNVHFLVVCDSGNQHWAFACYGRKVEKAYQLRRQGHPVRIVAERDFWDAAH